jgi:hypothetical protein
MVMRGKQHTRRRDAGTGRCAAIVGVVIFMTTFKERGRMTAAYNGPAAAAAADAALPKTCAPCR